LYRTLEGIAGRALEKITQTAGSELQEALDSRIRKRIGENAWNHLQNDQLGLAIRIMQEDGNSEEKKKAAAVRKLYEGAVKKFRNPTTHGYPYPTENSLSLEGEDWRKRLHEISTATGALAQVLAETWRWLISIEDASTQRPI
jgi:hypothetical protein